MAYPVRVAYLALMLNWAKEHGLDNMVEQKKILRPMVLRGLEQIATLIHSFWEGQSGGRLKTKAEVTSKPVRKRGSKQ